MLYSIIIGGIAGWLAGKILKGGGYGLVINILLGIGGGFVGGWLFNKFGVFFFHGIVGDLIEGVIGAIVLITLAGLLRKD